MTERLYSMSLTVSIYVFILPADGVVAMTTTFQGQGLAGYLRDSGQGGSSQWNLYIQSWLDDLNVSPGCKNRLWMFQHVVAGCFSLGLVDSHSSRLCCFSSVKRLSATYYEQKANVTVSQGDATDENKRSEKWK